MYITIRKKGREKLAPESRKRAPKNLYRVKCKTSVIFMQASSKSSSQTSLNNIFPDLEGHYLDTLYSVHVQCLYNVQCTWVTW